MSRVLRLTSPHLRGDDVQALQVALKNSEYGVFLQGKADGEYGPETMRAVKRAKYWLGYAERAIDGAAGPVLVPLLTGKRKLRSDQLKRRAARVKAAKTKPVRVKALQAALAAPNEKENPPGSNNCSSSRWYGLRGPWCAMDVTRWYVKAGSKAFKRGARYAYVPYIVSDARRGVNWLAITADPQPGDIVCYDWNRDGTFDHTGLFIEWTDRVRGAFKAREGNTAVGNDSNGGQRMTRDRHLTDGRVVFVHVAK